jgi:hypothetical protein
MKNLPVSEQEGQALQQSLTRLAEAWRQKLAEPRLRQLIESHQVEVSPLVQQLLRAFPSASRKPPAG